MFGPLIPSLAVELTSSRTGATYDSTTTLVGLARLPIHRQKGKVGGLRGGQLLNTVINARKYLEGWGHAPQIMITLEGELLRGGLINQTIKHIEVASTKNLIESC